MSTRFMLLGLALLASAPAQAEDYSSTYTQCMDKASSTAAMSTCIQAETQLQDERLNRVYKQLMAKLDASRQKALREVQRSWISYRDGNCAFHGNLSDGSFFRLQGGLCVLDMTKDRATELERVLSPGQ